MAERLLRTQPDSVANHVTACSISDWRALTWLATETGWTRRKRSAICSGKLITVHMIWFDVNRRYGILPRGIITIGLKVVRRCVCFNLQVWKSASEAAARITSRLTASMGNKLCATWQKGYHEAGLPWPHSRKEPQRIRLVAAFNRRNYTTYFAFNRVEVLVYPCTFIYTVCSKKVTPK